MSNDLQALRPVFIDDEKQFGEILSKVLSPSRPLQTQEYLRGREEQIKDIRRALYQDGRHVFIHGYRGVGKTSLAQTVAHLLQDSEAEPIIVGCGEGMKFSDTILEVMRKGLGENPQVSKQLKERTLDASGGIKGLMGGGVESRKAEELIRIAPPKTVNEAVSLMQHLVGVHSKKPIVLIDEFDKITSHAEQEHFADFIKQVSDQHVSMHLIFCGIGDTIDSLMKAHKSVNRYLHPVKLQRLDWEPRFEIVESAAKALGIEIDRTSTLRICRISDGFPHYIHLIAEKLFWIVFEEKSNGKVLPRQFQTALNKASDALDPELKIPYEKATKKYNDIYEEVLFAAADKHELQRPSKDIFTSYIRITGQLNKEPLSRQAFNGCLNRLKTPAHAEMLLATRTGWYEFKEKILRGYARLRAEQKGIELEVEHPAQPQKFAYRGAVTR